MNNKAIANTEYNHIWQILTALMEQDSDLADMVKSVSKKQGMTGANPPFLNDYIVLTGCDKHLDDLINVKILDNIGDTWEVRFGELIAYQKKFGRNNPAENEVGFETLANWTMMQRRLLKLGMLNDYRKAQLDSIGFEWDPKEALWIENFNELKAFQKEHGHANIPKSKGQTRLYKWCEGQRRSYHLERHRLSQERIDLLLGLGFDFKDQYLTRADRWETKFNQLKTFKEPNLKRDDPNPDNRGLAHWIEKQRADYLAGTIEPEKQKRLEGIGLILDVYAYKWQFNYDKFIKEYNEKNLSPKSRAWYSAQLREISEGKLKPERTALIEAIPKEQVKNTRTYEDILSAAAKKYIKYLIGFHKKHGHYNVRYVDNFNVYNMITKWRLDYKRGTIMPIVKKTLDGIGFNWVSERDHMFEKWEKSFKEYCKYKDDFNLPRDQRTHIPEKVKNFRLSTRAMYRVGKLDDKRIKLLESINFDWGKHA